MIRSRILALNAVCVTFQQLQAAVWCRHNEADVESAARIRRREKIDTAAWCRDYLHSDDFLLIIVHE